MYSLPEDVLENVLGFLTARELATAMCTAKFLRDAAQSRHLWQAHLAQNFRKFDLDEVRVGHPMACVHTCQSRLRGVQSQCLHRLYRQLAVEHKGRCAQVVGRMKQNSAREERIRRRRLATDVAWIFWVLPQSALAHITDSGARHGALCGLCWALYSLLSADMQRRIH